MLCRSQLSRGSYLQKEMSELPIPEVPDDGDRAHRMQRNAMRVNTVLPVNPGAPQQAFYTPPDHQVSSSTNDQNTQIQYFDQTKVKTEYIKTEYDAHLQSPTLSSSTNQQLSDFIMRPSGYLVDHHDSLAVLLGTTIEDPLLRHTNFPNNYQLAEVKQEPFDYTEQFIHHPLHEYTNYSTNNSNYATMMPVTTVSSTQSMVTSTSSTIASRTDTTSSSPILPVCPIPTEKTVDHFYNSTLAEMCKSLPDEAQIVRIITSVKGVCKPDPQTFAVHVAEENLKELVTWAKNNRFFCELKMDDQMTLLQGSWTLIHMIDITNAMVRGDLSPQYKISNGEDVSVGYLAVCGNQSNLVHWNDIVARLRTMGFTNYDYCAFRFLALFDPSLQNSALVEDVHRQVLQSWGEVRSIGPIIEVFEQIKRLAYDAQIHMWQLSVNGVQTWDSMGSNASLVLEMIRTSEGKMRGKREYAHPHVMIQNLPPPPIQTTYAPSHTIYMATS
ncbi:unnamed protein product [Caenorhabditis sp. 36 PRJEB53466]|nr:unnamed protein product [Caenorhabditis sp. 36 PRJEB53466]